MDQNQKNKILNYLDKQYPNAGCELRYSKDYELLIAVVLSAQTTDQAVNQVTPLLFKAFPCLEDLAKAPQHRIKKAIQTIGLFRTKAKHIKTIAKLLIEQHQGKVPSDKTSLVALPGVGNKTANVIRAELFNIPEIAVDTHVFRLAWRLGISKKKDSVSTTELKLRKAFPENRYIKLHHQLIHFGRYACKAKKPQCFDCPLQSMCKEPQKNLEKPIVNRS
ncbi:MAG: endonuclease III [Bacilli bacterium]